MKINQNGISMVYVLVAGAVIAGLGMFSMRSMNSSLESVSSKEFSTEVGEFAAQISTLLSHKQACFNSFQNLNASSTSGLIQLRDETGTIVIDNTTVYGNSGAMIDSMQLLDEPGTGDGVSVPTNGLGTTNLIVEFKERRGTFFKKTKKRKVIKLHVNTGGSYQLSGCYTASKALGAVWNRQAVDQDSIFYDAGNVAIGKNTALDALDVQGNIHIEDKLSSNYWKFHQTVSYYLISQNTTGPLIFRNNMGLADVEMRNLNLSGGVILGQNSVVCSGSNEGAIRFNSSANRVEVCEQGSWRKKKVMSWCLPGRITASASSTTVNNHSDYPDDLDYMKNDDSDDEIIDFTNASRRPFGEACKRSQADDIDGVDGSQDDWNETTGRIKFDDEGPHWCKNVYRCVEYNDSRQ